MTRHRSEAFGSKPVLLLLHGAGSTAAIFRIQTHFLAKALSPYFDLIYVDAPLRSAPGPGILPYFQGMDAYYRWFGAGIEKNISASQGAQEASDSFLSPETAASSRRLSKRRGSSSARTRGAGRRGVSPAAAINAAATLGLNLPRGAEGLSRGVMGLLDIANQSIPRQLEAQGVRSRDVVGVIGFSQGALAALGLLGVELAIGSPQWSNLRFCVAMGGATGGGAAQAAVAGMMAAANMLGGSKQIPPPPPETSVAADLNADSQLFPGHTVHVIGRCDPWVKDSRQIAGMCNPRRTKVVEFEGGHWVPREKQDISRVVDLILETELDSRREADDSSSSSSEDDVEVLMRRLDAVSVRS
ncbi:serine hydrolase FSH [Diaporthe sp. PMI_573]|nr:serine hydrolase FSH [Diaporthaceae sp. PMI_573]